VIRGHGTAADNYNVIYEHEYHNNGCDKNFQVDLIELLIDNLHQKYQFNCFLSRELTDFEDEYVKDIIICLSEQNKRDGCGERMLIMSLCSFANLYSYGVQTI
jgi:hypothetical protein